LLVSRLGRFDLHGRLGLPGRLVKPEPSDHARTGPRCMIRTEMRSFSCTQVLFIGVSQAHRAVDQRLRTCERRNSALAPLRQLPGPVETTPQPPRRANEADAGRLGSVGYSSISLRSPLHSVWNVPSRSTRLYV
jgi:hypothetical protein